MLLTNKEIAILKQGLVHYSSWLHEQPQHIVRDEAKEVLNLFDKLASEQFDREFLAYAERQTENR